MKQSYYKYKPIHSSNKKENLINEGVPYIVKETKLLNKHNIGDFKAVLNHSQKKGERLILLNKLSKKLLKTAPEEAFKYASDALRLGKVLNAKQQLIKTNLILGSYYRIINDHKNALEHYNDVKFISLEIEDKVSSSNAYVQVAQTYWKLGQLKEAIDHYTKGLEQFEGLHNEEVSLDLLLILGELNEQLDELPEAKRYYNLALIKQKELQTGQEQEADILHKMGVVQLLTGEFEKAEPLFLKALGINKLIKNTILVAENANSLGLVYMKLKQYDKAIHFLNDSFKINSYNGITDKIAANLKNLGHVHYELELFDSCIRNYKHALELYKDLGVNKEIASLLESIGQIYFLLKKYRKAITMFKQALNLGTFLKDELLSINCNLHLGKISLITRDPETAILHFDNCIRKAETANLQSFFIGVYEEIAHCYALLGQHEEAYKMQKKYNVLIEFKFSNNNRANVARLEDSTNIGLKQIKQLQSQNIELKRFITSAIQELRSPVRLVSSFSEMMITKDNDTEINQNSDEYLEIVNRSSKQINQFLKDIQTFIRIIDNSNYPTTNLNLNTILEQTTELLGINQQNSPVICIVPRELPKVNADKDEMTLVLESILRNSLNHNAGNEIKIWISFEEKDGHYIVSVEDNGIGVDKDFQELVFNQFTRIGTTSDRYEGTGIGLTMSKKILNNRNHDIWMETPSSGIGTRVSFTVSKPSV